MGYLIVIFMIMIFFLRILESFANIDIEQFQKTEDIFNVPDTLHNIKTQDEYFFYIFATLTMNKIDLENLIKNAKQYHGVVVLRGLKNNSMIQTIEYLQDILKDNLEGVIIDPVLFNKYNVQRVPTFILGTKEGNIDVLSGNVSMNFVLQKFASKGSTKDIAMRLLK